MADITLPVPGENPNWGSKLNTAILRINQELESLGVRVSVAETGLSSVTLRVTNLEGRVNSLESGLEDQVRAIAADVIASDPAIVAAAEAAVEGALDDVIPQVVSEMVPPIAQSIAIEEALALISSEVPGLVSEGIASERVVTTAKHTITGIGDSLTHAGGTHTTWMRFAAENLGSDWTHENLGVSNQTAAEIAARVGAAPTQLMFASNTVPASGSVTVTLAPGAANPLEAGQIQRLGGMLAGVGVRGQLEMSVSGEVETLTFVRERTGTAISLAGPIGFLSDQAGRAASGLPVILAGRNQGASDGETLDAIQAIVDQYKKPGEQYLILVPPSGDGWGDITALQASIKTRWPNNVIDLPTMLLLPETASAVGYTFTGDDWADVGNGVVPRGYRSDAVHWNTTGRQAVGWVVSQELIRRGWATDVVRPAGPTGLWRPYRLPAGLRESIPSEIGSPMDATGVEIGTNDGVPVLVFGSSSYAASLNFPYWTGDSSITMTFKVTGGSGQRNIANAFGLSFLISGGGNFTAYAGSSVSGVGADTSWHTATIVRRRPTNTALLYIDGVLVATGTVGGSQILTATLGHTSAAAPMVVADVAVYQRALTGGEAQRYHEFATAQYGVVAGSSWPDSPVSVLTAKGRPAGSPGSTISAEVGPGYNNSGITVGGAGGGIEAFRLNALDDVASASLGSYTGSSSLAVSFRLLTVSASKTIANAFGVTFGTDSTARLRGYAGAQVQGPDADTGWHTAVITRDRDNGNQGVLYLDGIKVAEGSLSGGQSYNAFLGNASVAADAWVIDMRVYKRVLNLTDAVRYHASASAEF